jgi:F-type H+-transporting ATPase subunit gamma
MQMVAASKLRKAQQAVTEARPYADCLTGVLQNLASRTEHSHPLLEKRDGGRTWLVVITSDKGLCGSFNQSLLRQTEKELRSKRWDDIELLTIGRKASDFFEKRDWTVAHKERDTMSKLTADDGPRIADMCIKAFNSGQVDSVWLMYNRFVNLIRQDITLEPLLPLEPPTVPEGSENDILVDYLYEPEAESILAEMLPAYVQTQVQRCLFDSAAAEQASRMTSMDAATKNAGEMIDSLTLLYNRTRQANITKELIEIVSGAQALGK